MRTSKKLKVAAAVAAMFAVSAGVQAASVSQSGGTFAMETIWPGTLPTPQSNFTRVRAPLVTYSFITGPNAQSNGEQTFQIVFTLYGGGVYAFNDNTAPFVSGELAGAHPPVDGSPGIVNAMTRNPAAMAEAITANLRGLTGPGIFSRIPVTAAEPGPGQYAIVLRSIDRGNTLPGSDPAVHTAINGGNPTTITYRFALVNKTGVQVSLSELDMHFNTRKTAGVVGGNLYDCSGACPPLADPATTTNAEFAAINNLADKVQRTIGHQGDDGCFVEAPGVIALRGNHGINNAQGTEPFLNVPATNVPVYNPAYLRSARATEIILGAGPNRRIATTNSFAENYSAFGLIGQNLTPTNGVGGQGGGRYTFVPTVKAVPSIGFGPALNPTVAGPAGPFTAGSASSGDERDAVVGTIRFNNRTTGASDRLMLADNYFFKTAAGVVASPEAWDFGNQVPQPNLLGAVDIAQTGTALQVVVTQTGTRIGTTLRLLDLTTLPVGQQNCAGALALGAGVVFAPVAVGGGVWNWNFTRADLQAAVGGAPNSLAGRTLSVCYNVPGNVTIPTVEFTNATATLFKDDITEQSLVSCTKPLTKIYGGVKIDVRNFSMAPAPWVGLLRIINNSEEDTAKVEGQYIWNNGAYGRYGTLIESLAPRAAAYVTSGEVLAKLTTEPVVNGATTIEGKPYQSALPTPANLDLFNVAGTTGLRSIRIRVSADVPTLRVQNYIFSGETQALTEVSSSQGADFANIESSNRDHIDQDAQTDIKK